MNHPACNAIFSQEEVPHLTFATILFFLFPPKPRCQAFDPKVPLALPGKLGTTASLDHCLYLRAIRYDS